MSKLRLQAEPRKPSPAEQGGTPQGDKAAGKVLHTESFDTQRRSASANAFLCSGSCQEKFDTQLTSLQALT